MYSVRGVGQHVRAETPIVVSAGCGVTAGVLIVGLIAFKQVENCIKILGRCSTVQ